jgi:two-component system NtrC family sensor kinase
VGIKMPEDEEQRYLSALCSICQDIISQVVYDQVLTSLVKNAAVCLNAKGASMMLINRETEQLEVVAAYGLSEDFLQKGPVAADKSISNCLKGKDIVIEDASKDQRVQYSGAIRKEGIKSIICIPLKTERQDNRSAASLYRIQV